MRLIDYIVIALYFGIVLGIGFLFNKQKSEKDFFFAEGKISWWVVGISMIATSVSATTFLGNPAEAFEADLRMLQMNIAPVVSIILVWYVFIPYFRQQNADSAYAILENRFDLKTRLLSSCLYMFHLILRMGMLLYGPAIVISQLTGVSIVWTIIIVGVITVTYSTMGGIKSVIWTDLIQFFILMVSALIAILICAYGVNGGFSAIVSQAAENGKLRLFDFSFSFDNQRNFVALGVAYIALDLAIRATDQQFVQRYMTVKDVKSAQYAALSSFLWGIVISVIFFFLGTSLWVYYHTGANILPQGLKADNVLPHFITTALPVGFVGLLVAGISSAAMSSISSAINALSNTALTDFIKRLNLYKGGNVRSAQYLSIVWGVLGIFAALFASTFGTNILQTALSFISLFTGALLGVFMLAVTTKRVSGGGAFFGALVGMALLALVKYLYGALVSWPWHPVISFSATYLFGILYSFVVPRTRA